MRGRSRTAWAAAMAFALLAGRGAGAGESTADAPKSPMDFRDVIQRAKERVFPALVHLRCIRENRERGTRESEQIGGSGILISKDGEFLTNWHVIHKAVEVRCMLFDGRAFRARIVGSDESTDLGLCRIDAPAGESLPWAEFGPSHTLTEGDFVMAMGAPWGMSRSVSLGIVACTGRYLPEHSEYSLWLQTDAAISPGNSGGPLVDTRGKVVGINARGFMQGGDIGFAIPSETIRQVHAALRAHGRVPWTWTGLELQPLRDFGRDMVFEGDEGVIVAGTDPDSPARAAGLRSNDRILSIDGTAVTARTQEDLPDLRRKLALLPAGAQTTLRVRRGEDELTITLVPVEMGTTEGEELELPRWDFSVKQINRFANPVLYQQRKKGVFVQGVKRPGNAKEAGLRRGDVLLRIGDSEITSLDEVRTVHAAAIANVDERGWVLVSVLRGGLLRKIVLEFQRDYERK